MRIYLDMQAISFNRVLQRMIHFFLPSSRLASYSFDKNDLEITSRISAELIGRAWVLLEFMALTREYLEVNQLLKVAVIGGYQNEPELLLLQSLGYDLEVDFFGVTENVKLFDLNSIQNDEFESKYDLILCSQVFEHIWNYRNAFQNIENIMNSDTYLWLAAPASNHPHGYPQYFSAGFTSDALVQNLQDRNFEVITSGMLGSPRNYLATHILPTWLSVKGHAYPLFKAFENFDRVHNIAYSMRYMLRTLFLCFVSPKVSTDVVCATESYAFAKLRSPSQST